MLAHILLLLFNVLISAERLFYSVLSDYRKVQNINYIFSFRRVARNGTLPPLDRHYSTDEFREKSPVSKAAYYNIININILLICVYKSC